MSLIHIFCAEKERSSVSAKSDQARLDPDYASVRARNKSVLYDRHLSQPTIVFQEGEIFFRGTATGVKAGVGQSRPAKKGYREEDEDRACNCAQADGER